MAMTRVADRPMTALGGSLVLRELPWAIAGIATATLASAIATFRFVGVDTPGTRDTGGWPWTIALSIILSAFVYGMVNVAIATDRRLDALAVGIGIAAVISLALFWSGAPLVLGFAALLLGTEVLQARGHRDDIPARGLLATALGLLAVPLGMLFCAIG